MLCFFYICPHILRFLSGLFLLLVPVAIWSYFSFYVFAVKALVPIFATPSQLHPSYLKFCFVQLCSVQLSLASCLSQAGFFSCWSFCFLMNQKTFQQSSEDLSRHFIVDFVNVCVLIKCLLRSKLKIWLEINSCSKVLIKCYDAYISTDITPIKTACYAADMKHSQKQLESPKDVSLERLY